MAGNGTGTGPEQARRDGNPQPEQARRDGNPQPEQARRDGEPRPELARTGGTAGQRAARGEETSGQQAFRRDEPGPEPLRTDKRRYFVLMGVCIALFVVSWAVVDRFSVLAAVIMSAVALVIPPFAAIVANVASATDRRRP